MNWIASINDQASVTGVEALLTTAGTVLEDGTQIDPDGDGYLLLFSRKRGSAARIEAAVDIAVDGLGFSPTRSRAHGKDAASS